MGRVARAAASLCRYSRSRSFLALHCRVSVALLCGPQDIDQAVCEWDLDHNSVGQLSADAVRILGGADGLGGPTGRRSMRLVAKDRIEAEWILSNGDEWHANYGIAVAAVIGLVAGAAVVAGQAVVTAAKSTTAAPVTKA